MTAAREDDRNRDDVESRLLFSIRLPAIIGGTVRKSLVTVCALAGTSLLGVLTATPALAATPVQEQQCLDAGGTFVPAADNPFANRYPSATRRDLCAVETWTVDGYPMMVGPTRESHVWQQVGDPVLVRERVPVGEPVDHLEYVPQGEAIVTTEVRAAGDARTTTSTRSVGSPVVVEAVDESTTPHRLVKTSTQPTEVVTLTEQPQEEVTVTTQRRSAVVTSTQAYENVVTITRQGETLNTYTTATVVDTFTYVHHHWWTSTGRLVPMSIYWVEIERNPGPDNVVQYPLPAEPKVSVTRTAVNPTITKRAQAAAPDVTESVRPLAVLVTEQVSPGEPVVTVTYTDLPADATETTSLTAP